MKASIVMNNIVRNILLPQMTFVKGASGGSRRNEEYGSITPWKKGDEVTQLFFVRWMVKPVSDELGYVKVQLCSLCGLS